MKPKGSWVAVPMNIHRINWMWGGKKALDKAGITTMPATWAEFNADCDKLKAGRPYSDRAWQRRLDRCHDL